MNYSLFAASKHLVKKELDNIIDSISKKQDVTIDFFDGNDKDFNVESLIYELNTIPFLSDHKIIVLENPLFLSAKGSLSDSNISYLENYLKDPAKFSTLIIYVNQFKVDKRKKISKIVSKYTKVFEPKEINDYTLSDMISSDLKSLNINIDRLAKAELDKRIINNFDNWENELEKINLYNKKHLSFEDIDLLVSHDSENNVFDLVNGVLNNDLKKSLLTYRNLDKSLSEPIALIMLLANQFRLIHQIKTLMDARVAYDEYAKILKVHPYRVQVASQIARKTSTQQLLSVLDKLSTLEQKIKSGLINPEIGFELFLIEVNN